MDWPVQGSNQKTLAYGRELSGATQLTRIRAHTPAHTLGAWVEICASTPANVTGLVLSFAVETIGVDCLVNVGIGAGPATIIPNIIVSSPSNHFISTYYFPITVPPGVSLKMQCQSSTAYTYIRTGVMFLTGDFGHISPYMKVVALGATTADSGGILIDPGSSANTKGAWTSLGTLTQDIKGLVLGFGTQAANTEAWAQHSLDIGIDSGGTKYVVLPDFALFFYTQRFTPPLFLPIPIKAQEVFARAQSNGTTAGTRDFDLILYGIC